MSVIIFACIQCGTCCRNLIEDVNGIANGLHLTLKETRLFPSELISPYFAIGTKQSKHIISYQLNVDVCPHLTGENECRIYEKRPLTCKAFPLEITLFKSTASVKCPIIGSQMKEGEFREIEFSSTELEASTKLNRYLWNRFQKYGKANSKFWKFDLRTKTWIEPQRRTGLGVKHI